MSTATRTVLFTDLVDYTTRVSHADREGLHRILKEHEGLVRPAVEENGGHVIKNIGDSFLCLFPSATDALRASLEILHTTHTREDFGIRIAVNTGDVEEIEGDAFGDTVNLASRILQKTPADECWFGLGTRLCMKDAEIPWEPVGRLRLKGIAREQDCFRVVPRHKVWLPHRVAEAVRSRRLVRLQPGAGPPRLPPDPVILFEGFKAESRELEEAIAALPILDPAALFLATYILATDGREEWTDTGRGLVIGTAEAVEAAIDQLRRTQRRAPTSESDVETMAIATRSFSYLELVICGLALPKVPFSDVVDSYSYDLLADGRWVTRAEEPVLRVEVRPEGTILRALNPGISVNGRLLSAGESVPLRDSAAIGTPAITVEFRPINQGYRGVLLSETPMRLSVIYGQTAELGRKPNPPGLAFPSRDGQENIHWCSGSRAARARASGFTFDRALAGRRQAAVKLATERIEVVPLHETCATYLLHDGALERVQTPHAMEVGDMVVAGTTVVRLRTPG